MKQALLTVLLFLVTTLSVWATDITVQQEVIRNWTGPRSNVQLWLVLDKPVTTNDAKNIPASSVDRGVVAVKSVCTVASVTRNGLTQYDLTIPETILYSTLDAVVGNDARYTAYFYQSNGTRISVWSGFASFVVPAIPASTTWGALRIYNSPALNAPLRNDNVYNTDQINAINNGLAGTTSLDYVLGNTSPWNSTNFNIFVGSGGSRPGLRWDYLTNRWKYSNDGSVFNSLVGISASGTTNKLSRFSDETTIADSMFSQDSGGTTATIAGAATVTGITDIQGGLPSAAYNSLPTTSRGNGSLYWDSTNKQLRYFNAISGQWISVSGGLYNVQDFGATGDGYGTIRENKSIVVTNGATAITSNGRFPARWVGLNNISVQLNSVSYTIASCTSTSQCTLSSNYLGTTSSFADLYAPIQANITGASTTVVCNVCNFTASDEGKKIVLSGVNGAAAHVTTINTRTNSTTIEVLLAPPTTGTVDITFGTDNTSAFAGAMTACDASGGGRVYVPHGIYLLNYLSLPRRTYLIGSGKQSAHIWSYASSGGIIRSIWPSNASNGIYSTVTGLHIKALDTNSVQYGFHDNGGSHLRITENSFENCHISLALDQSEVVQVDHNDIVSYQPTYYGISSGRLAPDTNGGWTKTGSFSTGTDSGLWLIGAGTNTINTYTKALSSTAFYKGFTLEIHKGVSVASAENASFDDAKLYRVDNGSTQRFDLQFTSSQIRLNGGTARSFGASSSARLRIALGGSTADLYINGVLVDSNIAALSSSGSAVVGFGDFTTTDDAAVYYGPITYYSSATPPIGVWLLSGEDITTGNLAAHTNIIQVTNNQINGNFFHFISDGGTDQYFGANNLNGGLHSVRVTGVVNFTVFKNGIEACQWENVLASGFKIGGLTGGSTTGLQLEKNTFNNSVVANLPIVRITSSDSVQLNQNVYTKGPSQGYCLEIDQGGVSRVYAPNESTANGADSLFGDTTRTLSADANNLAIGPYDIVYFAPSGADRIITGFSGGKDRRTVTIVNNGSYNLTLSHQSGSSDAANRIKTTAGFSITIGPDQMGQITYDPIALRWRATLLQ